MRVIIAGSRTFTNYTKFRARLIHLFSNIPLEQVTIISGTARGADQMGEQFAAELGLNVERYPAEWDRFGKSAGYRRNEVMAAKADALVAFWDGKSPGTKHMIDLAKARSLNVRIVAI
jgi:hypothetical protein